MLRYGVLFLFLAAVPAAAQFSFLGIKNSLVDFVLEQISVPGELEITAEGVEDAEDGATEIIGLTVADGGGVWLSIDRLAVRWNSSRILRGELEINRLSAEGVDVIRAPAAGAAAVEVKEGSALAETDDEPFDWPRSPITTRVEAITLTDVDIAPGVFAPVGVAFDADGALRDEGDEQALRLNITRRDDIAGRILVDFLRRFGDDRLDLTLEAEEAPGGIVATLADFPPDSATRVNLVGAGPLNDWALTFDARSDDVFEAAGEATVAALDRLAVQAAFTVTPGASLSPEIQRALAPAARLIIDVAEDDNGVISIREGALTARDLTLSAAGSYVKASGVADLDVSLEARAGLSELVDGFAFTRFGFTGAVDGPLDALTADGRLTLDELSSAAVDIGGADLSARVDVLGEDISLTVSGGARDMRLDKLGPDVLGEAEIAVQGAYNPAAAKLDMFRINAAPLDLTASGEVDLVGEALAFSYDLSAPDLSPLAAAYDLVAEGALGARGSLAGPIDAPVLTGDAALENLALDGEAFGFVRLTHDATLGEALSGAAALTADGSRFGAVSFAGDFGLSGDDLTLSDLTATGLGARIDGALSVDLAQTLAAGEVTLGAPDMREIGRAVGQDMTGALRGAVTLSGANGKQDARADLSLNGFRGAGLSLATARVDARAANLTDGDPTLAVSIRASDTAIATLSLNEIIADVNGRLSALAASIAAKGDVEGVGPLTLDSAARADLTGATQRITVSQLDLSVGDAEIGLRKPLAVTLADGVTALRDIDIAVPGGGLTGRTTLYGGGATGDLALDLTDLSTLAALAEAPVEDGSLSATARFDTRASRAGAEVTLTGRDVRFADALADVGALNLDMDLDWNGREASVDARLSGPFEQPLRVTAATPVRPSGGIAPRLPPNGALTGRVDWVGDVGEFWALVPAPGHVLDGGATIALTLGGTLEAPTVGGDVALTDGRYENLDVGSILVDLNVTSRVEPDGAFALSVAAEDGAGGPVTAEIELADGALDAKLTTEGATLVRRDDVTAEISLDITANGPVTAPRIAGVIGIDRAEIRLVAATPPGVADLGPVRIKGEEPEPDDGGAGGAIALDIKVEAPDDIFVRGRGLDSEWMLDLSVTGTAAAPKIDGAVEKRRGRLTFLGAPLELERGEVRFFNRTPPDPQIDVLLERENDGVTGGIAVTGAASAPEINFVSRPALPEDEVLPRILFGQSQQSLSPTQALSLALGVATLLDGTGGATDSIRSSVGVDVLRIEDGDDGPAVTVGTNIVDGVFVSTTQPVGGGSAKVQVEVEVFDEFTIDSETGADIGTSVGLNWKRDF